MNFDSLYKKYYSKVKRHVSGLLNHIDVDDVVQEIFLKIEKGLPYFKEESKLSTWIHSITVNHCIDIIRKRKAHHLRVKSNNEVHHINNTPCGCKDIESNLINAEMNECINNYIKTLPDIYKEIVLLSDIEGYSNNEIASKLDISIESVKVRLHRGRQKLKNILTKQCCLFFTENNELACYQK
jgi:RNA polymerase sigma-70 factor, ECF subfamily